MSRHLPDPQAPSFMKAPYFAAGLLFYLVFCSTNVVAAGATAGKARGSYRDWNVDAVTIVRPFRFSSYRQVVVLPLDTRGVRLPPREENTHQLAKEVLSTANELFLQGLKDNLRGANVDVIGGQGGRDGVLVRARLEKLDPGLDISTYVGTRSRVGADIDQRRCA